MSTSPNAGETMGTQAPTINPAALISTQKTRTDPLITVPDEHKVASKTSYLVDIEHCADAYASLLAQVLAIPMHTEITFYRCAHHLEGEVAGEPKTVLYKGLTIDCKPVPKTVAELDADFLANRPLYDDAGNFAEVVVWYCKNYANQLDPTPGFRFAPPVLSGPVAKIVGVIRTAALCVAFIKGTSIVASSADGKAKITKYFSATTVDDTKISTYVEMAMGTAYHGVGITAVAAPGKIWNTILSTTFPKSLYSRMQKKAAGSRALELLSIIAEEAHSLSMMKYNAESIGGDVSGFDALVTYGHSTTKLSIGLACIESGLFGPSAINGKKVIDTAYAQHAGSHPMSLDYIGDAPDHENFRGAVASLVCFIMASNSSDNGKAIVAEVGTMIDDGTGAAKPFAMGCPASKLMNVQRATQKCCKYLEALANTPQYNIICATTMAKASIVGGDGLTDTEKAANAAERQRLREAVGGFFAAQRAAGGARANAAQ